MKLAYDDRVRVVSVEVLRTLCAHVSNATCRFWIEKVSRSRVWVGCRVGFERPTFAVFPCWPGLIGEQGDRENPVVALYFLRVVDDAGAGEQAFTPVLDCQLLTRVA